MTVRHPTPPDGEPATGPGVSRARVLAALEDAGRPLGVVEIAKRVRLHPNTVRFHLDALAGAGLVEQSTEDRERPGRPRVLYRALPGRGVTGQRSYRLLAEILAGYLASTVDDPVGGAIAAGREWGRYLADRPPPFSGVDAEEATRRLVAVLDGIGFAPEAVGEGERREVLLHHCPFRETAASHGNVVCAVHLGLMRGVLAEIGAPVEAEWLDPFVEPDVCVAHLAVVERP